jgi:DNA-binding XRE family transcriptional regulator
MERRLKDSFLARSDDGQEVTVLHSRVVRVTHPLGGTPPGEVEGAPDFETDDFETDDGEPVNELGGGRYEVATTRVVYMRVGHDTAGQFWHAPGRAPDAPGAAPMAEPDRQPTKTIRQLRQAWGWSRPVLAGRLGVHPMTVWAWERGRMMPNPSHRQALADLFGVSVQDIAAGPADQPSHDAP